MRPRIAPGSLRGALPLALMTVLILVVGGYTAASKDAFLTSYNLRNLLLATMPLALVSLGQTSALLVGGFDVSVAAVMTMCVVTASFTLTSGMSNVSLVFGALALVGVGLATGTFNAVLIRIFRLPSIVATLGTLSILEGASLALRDHPEGSINFDVISSLTTSAGFVPSSCSPSSATPGCTDRGRGLAFAPSGSTRRRRGGSGWAPGGGSSSPSSSAP
jgi:ribose/xylose/arabinose/galactoside ABC-type transport system permease subunit